MSALFVTFAPFVVPAQRAHSAGTMKNTIDNKKKQGEIGLG